jgi:O-antigen ligase
MFAAFLSRLLPLSLALIPLIITPGILFYYDVTPKIVLLLFATAMMLLFVKPAAAGWSQLVSERTGRWFVLLLAAQVVSIMISTAFADDLALAVTGGSWRRLGAVTAICVLVFAGILAGRIAASLTSVNFLLQCVTAGCLATSIYGIFQFFGFDPLLPASAYRVGEGIWTIIRPPSTMGNANYFASYLSYAVFFPAALLSTRSDERWKTIAIVAISTGSLAIVLSGTRAGILGWLTGVMVLVLGSTPKLRQRVLVFLMCGAAALAALSITPVGRPLRARMHWSQDDASGGGRLLLWRDSARLFLAHPFAGIGPDGFPREFPKFRSLELAQLLPDFYQESPHNLLVDAAVTQGISGMILAIATIALGLFAAAEARAVQPGLALGVGAALVSGTVCGQFSSPVLVTSLYQLTTLAILCAIAKNRESEPIRYPAILPAVSWALAALFLLWGGSLAASDFLAGSLRHAIENGRTSEAVGWYDSVTTRSLTGFQIDLYASRAFARAYQTDRQVKGKLQAWGEAVRAGDRATVSAEDRQNAFFNRASLCAQQEDAAGAERNLRMAVREAPTWFKPHWILAQLLERTGRPVEAREEAKLAMLYDAGKDEEVVATWRALGSPR